MAPAPGCQELSAAYRTALYVAAGEVRSAWCDAAVWATGWFVLIAHVFFPHFLHRKVIHFVIVFSWPEC